MWKWIMFTMVVGLLWLPAQAENGNTAVPTSNLTTREAELRQQIFDTMEARQAALQNLSDRYREARYEERTTLEAMSDQIQKDYEFAYLSLLVEYHGLTGNVIEQERAQRMLDALANTAGTVPREQDALPLPNETGQEGVNTDAR